MTLPKTFAEGEVLTAGDLNAALVNLDGRVTTVTPGAWSDVTLAANFAASDATVKPRVRLRQDGLVEFRTARIKRTTSDLVMTAGALYVVATIPAGFRPTSAGATSWGGAFRNNSGVPVVCEWIVQSDGTLSLRPGAATTWAYGAAADQGIGYATWQPA